MLHHVLNEGGVTKRGREEEKEGEGGRVSEGGREDWREGEREGRRKIRSERKQRGGKGEREGEISGKREKERRAGMKKQTTFKCACMIVSLLFCLCHAR